MKNKILIIFFVLISAAAMVIIISIPKSGEPNDPAENICAAVEISRYTDSSFVDDKITTVLPHNNKYYILESGAKRMVVLDSNMNYIYSIGKEGQGPGEFIYPGCIAAAGDTLYVTDYPFIKIFSAEGKYVRQCLVKQMPISPIRFAISGNGNIVIPLYDEKYPIHELENGRSIRSFGSSRQYSSAKETCIKNMRHIAVVRNLIFAVREGEEPIAELYDYDGNIKDKLDLSSVAEIKELINFRNQNPVKHNPQSIVFQVYFNDVSIHNDKIYLLFNKTMDKREKHSVNVVVLKVDGNKLIYSETLKLFDKNNNALGWGRALCKTKDKLLVADGYSGKLFVFSK